MPKYGGLKAARFSVTWKCKTEKLWHPLLLEGFTDGSYLHRTCCSDADMAEARRNAEQADRKEDEKIASLSDFRTLSCPTQTPIEKLLIRGIYNFLYNTHLKKKEYKGFRIQTCLTQRFIE